MDRIARLQYLLARFVLWSLAHAPRGLATFYARLMDLAVPRLRRVAMRNLAMAYPDKTPAERKTITDEVFRSIGRLLYVFAHFPQMNRENISQWIRYDGLEHFVEAKKAGKGVLFAAAHAGSWELSAYSHALMTEIMHVVIRPLDNPRIDRLVEDYRQLSGNHLIEKWDGARAILRALQANEAVGILIDQNTAQREGVFVNFFGTPACTNPTFAKIAYRTGAAVIPAFALWLEKEQRHVLRFLAPVPMSGDPLEDTQRLQSMLEGVVREYPGQWLWIHRRWKTRPPGEPAIY